MSIALHLYTDDNGGSFPPEPGFVCPAHCDNPRVLFCPKASAKWRKVSGPDRIEITKPSYVYVAGLKDSDPEQCVLAFDRLENHDGQGQNVLCVDSSVQWIKAPPRGQPGALQEMREKTREAVKKRGGEIKLVGE